MTPEAMAALHARAFTGLPPPWTSEAFDAFLSAPATLAVVHAHGFALGWAAASEAELATLAVDPDFQRRGVGKVLLQAFEASAAEAGASMLYLEVAADNDPAKALYARGGFEPAGRRPGYYSARGRVAVDALVLHKRLVSVYPARGGAASGKMI
jgi:ribosomal-protein-alanine N-acetyltransferase